MGEYKGSFTEKEKKVLLSLIAIERITTLKLHKIFKDLNSIEKILELSIPELYILVIMLRRFILSYIIIWSLILRVILSFIM